MHSLTHIHPPTHSHTHTHTDTDKTSLSHTHMHRQTLTHTNTHTHTTQKQHGLLWVWPESTAEAKLVSASPDCQPPSLPHVDEPTRSAWYIREVPIRCV